MIGQETKNHYDLLGVSQEATTDDIRKAYRKLAKRYHPDKTGGDVEAEEKLKKINSAYDTLKNNGKRQEYDQQLKYGSGFDGFSGGGFHSQEFSGDVSDIFSTFFGQGTQNQRNTTPRKGRDLRVQIEISFVDVLNGTTRTLKLNKKVLCDSCTGVPTTSCQRCSGHGFTTEQKTIQVSIPMGIQDGARLRVAGEGDVGVRGGPSGDLYVVVQKLDDPFFTRDGNHVKCQVPITFANAALGGTVEVPTLTGRANLTIPEGTQNGAQLRLKGQGLPTIGGGRGDEIVHVIVEIPRKLSEKQKELIGEFSDEPIPERHPLIAAFKSLLNKFRK